MIRVATLNIWNFFGPWAERAPALLAAIRGLDADVIGLQEVVRQGADRDHVAWLERELGLNVVWGEAQGGVGNAILTKHAVEYQETFVLPNGGTHEQRSIVHAKIATPSGSLPFFSTHLNYKLDEGHVRAEQVRACAAFANLRSEGLAFPPVMVGDFNAPPDADEIRYFKGLTSLGGPCVYFVDAFEMAGEGSGVTWSKANPFTASWMEPDRRIDYVFVGQPRSESLGYVQSARVWATEQLGGVHPTDHFGVVSELSSGGAS